MNTMNQEKFLAQYKHALSSDFVAADGTPAKLSPGMPLRWGSESKNIKFDSTVSTLALSNDDSLLAVGIGKLIHIYTLSNLDLQQTLEGHSHDVNNLEFAPKVRQGYKLMSGSEDYQGEDSVIVWDLTDDGKDVNPPRKVDIVAIAKKAANVAVEELKWQPGSKMAQSLEAEFGIAMSAAVAKKGLEGKTILEGSFPGFGSVPFSRDGSFMCMYIPLPYLSPLYIFHNVCHFHMFWYRNSRADSKIS
jgi:WD40 repeat protein